MDKKTMIIWGVVIVALVIGGWYLASRNKPSTQTIPSETASTTEESGTASDVSKTSAHANGGEDIRAVVAQGGNYTCSVESIGNEGKVLGTIYGAGGKTRLDLSTEKSDGSSVRTHIIRSDASAYTWVDGQSSGIRSAITASSPIINQPSGGVIETTDDGTIASNCRPWFPDASQFTPPAGITFVAR